ncbi:hypothetical protein Tco_1246719 [Tanacetum coccineum]
MGAIDDMKSTLTQSALDALCEKFHIPNTVHLKLPGRNNRIRNSPTGKISLSVIAAAKVSHFEILRRVHGFVPTVGNFRSRYYEFDDDVYSFFLTDDDEEMDLFAFINHADPTKVRIGENKIKEGKTQLLESTRVRVVPLVGINDQGNQNDDVEDARNQNDDVQDARNNDEVPATVAEKSKESKKKRKATGGASSSSLPPKKLRDSHGTPRAVASTGGKSTTALQSLLEGSTLAVEVGVAAAAIAPFVTSFVSFTPEHPPCHSSSNVTDAEVSSVAMSLVLDPPIMTTVIATTVIADTSSTSVPRAGHESVHHTLFADSASMGEANPDITGPSYPAGTELSTDSFYVSQDMDSETLHQTYVPKWNTTYDSTLDDLDVFCSVIDHLAPPVLFSQLRSMDHDQLLVKFNVGAARQTCLSSEVKLWLEHDLRDRKKLEGRCTECQVASLESQKDSLINQVSSLESTCSGFRNQVSGYELFKEQYEAVQDEQVKILSDKVAGIDADLMGMALHLDEEFYPRLLTTIAGRRWILSCGLRLVVMKCLQSPEYLAALGRAIGRTIDKGMQDGLVASIDHGKAGRGLADIAAYNPSTEASYVLAVNALRVMDFPLLAQLAS